MRALCGALTPHHARTLLAWLHIVSGYSAKEVKALLARVGAGEGEGSRLKRVVMLSSVGVNRRDDLMIKLRQMHTNLDERVGVFSSNFSLRGVGVASS